MSGMAEETTTMERHDEELERTLRDLGCYESAAGLEEREHVLRSLNLLLKQFMQSVSLSYGVHWQDLALCSSGRVLAYGSLKLGTAHQGADIDALCVVPYFVTREDFFSSFYRILDHLPEVSELRAIEEAYVPVIKMKFENIEVDLTFARLNVEQVPEDDDCLRDFPVSSLDARSARSLNGFRSNQALLDAVPNIQTFQIVLRAVKLWAKSQGLYSNTLGFLGGFSWALLVAKCCIDCPHLNASSTLIKFFELFSDWPWPTPVTIAPLSDFAPCDRPTSSKGSTTSPLSSESHSAPSSSMSPSPSDTSLFSSVSAPSKLSHLSLNYNLPQYQPQSSSNYGFAPAMSSWNPDRNVSERHHVMPIITPSFPHQNSTFNVSLNTRNLIVEKMKKALSTCKTIASGGEVWSALFKTDHVIFAYKHFLWIVASAIDHVQWFGLIESKIRYFISNVEKESNDIIRSARIWPRPFTKKGDSLKPTNQLWIIGLDFCVRGDPSATPDISRALSDFRCLLESHSRKFRSREMRLEARIVGEDVVWKFLSPKDIEEIIECQHVVEKLEPQTKSITIELDPLESRIEGTEVDDYKSDQKCPGSGDQEDIVNIWETANSNPTKQQDNRSNGRHCQPKHDDDQHMYEKRKEAFYRSEVRYDKRNNLEMVSSNWRYDSDRRLRPVSRPSKLSPKRGNFNHKRGGNNYNRRTANRDFNVHHETHLLDVTHRNLPKSFTTAPPPLPLLKRSRSTSGASNSSASNQKNNFFESSHMALHHSSSSASLMTHIFNSPPPPTPDSNRLTSSTDLIGTPDRWSVSSNGSYSEGCDYHSIGNDMAESIMDIYPSLENDSVRTVSLTSDKFPPQALVQARIQSNLDRVPFSPSTPPPSLISTRSPQQHSVQLSSSNNSIGYFHVQSQEQTQRRVYFHNLKKHANYNQGNGSQRVPEMPSASVEDFSLCSSPGEELRDLSTPQPVEHFHYQPLTINLSSSSKAKRRDKPFK